MRTRTLGICGTVAAPLLGLLAMCHVADAKLWGVAAEPPADPAAAHNQAVESWAGYQADPAYYPVDQAPCEKGCAEKGHAADHWRHWLDSPFEPRSLGSYGGWGTLDVGGQIRLRYHHERGMGQQPGATRFQATDNDLQLTHLRLHGD